MPHIERVCLDRPDLATVAWGEDEVGRFILLELYGIPVGLPTEQSPGIDPQRRQHEDRVTGRQRHVVQQPHARQGHGAEVPGGAATVGLVQAQSNPRDGLAGEFAQTPDLFLPGRRIADVAQVEAGKIRLESEVDPRVSGRVVGVVRRVRADGALEYTVEAAHADRVERVQIQAVRAPAFPQREQAVLADHHVGVGGVGG